MKKLLFLAVTALSSLSGCQTLLTQEFRYSGGNIGYALDKRTFDASESKQLQLLRATMIMSMAARLGADTVKNGDDAAAFAQYLQATADEINYTAANIYPSPAGTADLFPDAMVGEPCLVVDVSRSNKNCRGYYVNFESDLPLINARMLRLVLAALPDEHAANFLDNAISGDVLGAAFDALRVAADAAESIHRVAAVYRTTIEIVGSGQVNSSLDCAKIPADFTSTNGLYKYVEDPGYEEKDGSVSDASRCIGHTELVGLNNRYELLGKKVNPTVHEDGFKALMTIARASCVSLPLANTTNLQDVAGVRNEICKTIAFFPRQRPETIVIK